MKTYLTQNTSDLILPSVNYDPALDYSQDRILQNMRDYLAIRNHKNLQDSKDSSWEELPFGIDLHNGVCLSLTGNWGYLKLMGMESTFEEEIRKVVLFDKEAFAKSAAKQDPAMEATIQKILFLQYFHSILTQGDFGLKNLVERGLNFIVADEMPRFAEPEFEYLFVFNRQSLLQLFTKVIFPNKLISLNNSLHTVAIVLSGGQWNYYDPNNSKGPIKLVFDALEDLVEHVFYDVGRWCGSHNFITLSVTANDLEHIQPQTYPDPATYSRELLQDPQYLQEILQHPMIFHYAMETRNFALADLLYEFGYKYVPWVISKECELQLAVFYNDHARLDYMLGHGMPIDYRPPNGITALANAIKHNRIPMLYKLLAAGANPNVPPSRVSLTYIKMALLENNTEAISLLLAFGANLSQDELGKLRQQYSNTELKNIFSQALAINYLILQLTEAFDSKKANIWQIIDFCLHEKLRAELAQAAPDAMIKKITDILNAALTKLIKKKIAKHSDLELYELEVVQKTVNTLLAHSEEYNNNRALVKALEYDKKIIDQYLRKNKVSSVADYLDVNKHEFYTRQHSSLIFSLPPEVAASASNQAAKNTTRNSSLE